MSLRAKLMVQVLCGGALAALPAAGVVTLLGSEAAFAKNGGEGNGGGNGGGNSGGNGGGRGGERSSGNSDAGAKGTGKSSAGGGKAPVKAAAPKASPPAVEKKAAAKASNGKLASELKGLNAAHASAQALLNASDNSRVGRIRAYAESVGATDAANEDLAGALAELSRLQGLTQEQIDSEFADPYGYDKVAYDAAVDAAQDAADADALAALTGLTDEQRAAQFPSTWDSGSAYDAALADAGVDVTDAETAVATAEADQDNALAEAGGANLSPEAVGYLHQLLGLDAPDAASGEEEPAETAATE